MELRWISEISVWSSFRLNRFAVFCGLLLVSLIGMPNLAAALLPPTAHDVCAAHLEHHESLKCEPVKSGIFVKLEKTWSSMELVSTSIEKKKLFPITHDPNSLKNQKNISGGSFSIGADAVSFESASPIEGTTIKGLWFPSETGPVHQVIGDAELVFIRDKDGSSFTVWVQGLSLLNESDCLSLRKTFPVCVFDQGDWHFPDHLFQVIDLDHDSVDELVYTYFWGQWTAVTAFNFINSAEKLALDVEPVSIRYAGNQITTNKDHQTITVLRANGQQSIKEVWKAKSNSFELVELSHVKLVPVFKFSFPIEPEKFLLP